MTEMSRNADAYAVSVRKMDAGYGARPAVKNVTFQVRKGEILTLIGPNGAGKSTVLKALCGQLKAMAGTILLDGRDIEGIRRPDLARSMAVLLTERVRPERMTCEDVVFSGRYPYTGKMGLPAENDRRIVREEMERVHMWDLRDRDFSQTSDGQKQMVLFARALCQQPEVLVLDEPTSFLDIRYKIDLLRILRQLAGENKMAVVLSLHELDLARQIADQVLCVKNGCADRIGRPKDVFTADYIQSLYGIPEGSFDEASCTIRIEPRACTRG